MRLEGLNEIRYYRRCELGCKWRRNGFTDCTLLYWRRNYTLECLCHRLHKYTRRHSGKYFNILNLKNRSATAPVGTVKESRCLAGVPQRESGVWGGSLSLRTRRPKPIRVELSNRRSSKVIKACEKAGTRGQIFILGRYHLTWSARARFSSHLEPWLSSKELSNYGANQTGRHRIRLLIQKICSSVVFCFHHGSKFH